MVLFPNAKINIGLNIIQKRADGYHDLETIFYPVKMTDILEIIESDILKFSSSGATVPGNPNENICLKAWDLLSRDYTLPPVHIHLYKNIPAGAGLGGGSADAAFLIRLVNQKFDLKMDVRTMENYASRLGADCAFFIQNKPVFAQGIGNEFEKTDLSLNGLYLVLVMPDLHISTADAFDGIKPVRPMQSLRNLIKLPIGEWKNVVANDFERTIFPKYPLISQIKESLYNSGALYASMSGTGCSVYGIFEQPVKLPQLEIAHRVFYES